jgi:hypothetical protein
VYATECLCGPIAAQWKHVIAFERVNGLDAVGVVLGTGNALIVWRPA